MIDGRFDQHFLEVFAGRETGLAPMHHRLALGVVLGLLVLTGGVLLA